MMETLNGDDSMNMTVSLRNNSKDSYFWIKQFEDNQNIDEPVYSILIALYSFLIILGSTGNVFVVLAVLRNKQMQTAR